MASASHYGLAAELARIAPHLAHEIALVAEQAFRRGFQQGALYGAGRGPQVHAWRYPDVTCRNAYAKATTPPGVPYAYRSTSLERLTMEASHVSPLVDALTSQYSPFRPR